MKRYLEISLLALLLILVVGLAANVFSAKASASQPTVMRIHYVATKVAKADFAVIDCDAAVYTNQGKLMIEEFRALAKTDHKKLLLRYYNTHMDFLYAVKSLETDTSYTCQFVMEEATGLVEAD